MRRALQAAAVALATAPLALLAARAAGFAGGLGANPVEELIHTSGAWALRCLLLCLAVTPARRALRLAALAPLRRTFGLAAFGWACLHVLAYTGLDLGFDGAALAEDLRERRYVFAGLTAFLCLVPLAATSTRAAQRRLGRRWKSLHRLVFVAAAAALTHYVWLVKADLLAPLAYAALFAVLVGLRLRRASGRAPAARLAEPARAGGRRAAGPQALRPAPPGCAAELHRSSGPSRPRGQERPSTR